MVNVAADYQIRGGNMTKERAHEILDLRKLGSYFAQSVINEALYVCGDLNEQNNRPRSLDES